MSLYILQSEDWSDFKTNANLGMCWKKKSLLIQRRYTYGLAETWSHYIPDLYLWSTLWWVTQFKCNKLRWNFFYVIAYLITYHIIPTIRRPYYLVYKPRKNVKKIVSLEHKPNDLKWQFSISSACFCGYLYSIHIYRFIHCQ